MSVYSKLKCILSLFIKFGYLKLDYLISNPTKQIWIKRYECIFKIKMLSLVILINLIA